MTTRPTLKQRSAMQLNRSKVKKRPCRTYQFNQIEMPQQTKISLQRIVCPTSPQMGQGKELHKQRNDGT